MKRVTLIESIRFAAGTALIILALLWFSFAILSGTEHGLGGFVSNLPNALPWLWLLAIVYVAFRWELLGSVLVLCSGIASIFFFNAGTAPVVLVGISLPLMVVGTALIVCHYLAPRDQGS